MRTKTELLDDLHGMLASVFDARSAGGTYARVARAQGYVDGYMRALLESGIASKEELLALVGTERHRACGPAVKISDEWQEELFQVA